MAASDYMVGNAPAGASYAAPLVGQFLGQQFEKMPQEYFQGTQNRRTLDMQRPILGPDGQPTTDPNAIVSEMLKRGGGEYAEKLTPFLMQMQADAPLNNLLAGKTQQPAGASTGPATATNASGPANITARPQSSAPAKAGPPGSPAATVQDQPTIMKVVASQGFPNDQIGAVSASLARQLGVGPNDPIDTKDPQVINVLGPALAQLKRMGVGQVVQPGQQPGAPQQSGAPAPAAGAPGTQQPGSTAPIQPRPVQTQPVPAAPAARAPVEDAQADDPTLGGLIPQNLAAQGMTPSQYRDFLSALASRPGISANAKDVALARIKAIDDYMSKGATAEHEAELAKQKAQYDFELGEKKSTDQQKNARSPEVSQFNEEQERNKLNVKRWDDDQQAYTKMARQADEARPQLQIAARMTQDPGFISGSGQKFQDALANLKASFGLGNNASINQVFDKIRAGGILDQIKGMAGTGPVRVAEMKFIDQMMAGRENQPDALRAVLNIQDRLYQRAQDIRDLIRANGGNINKDVEGKIDDFVKGHALFTPKEMKDYRAIGAPTFNTPQEVHASGLPSGSPFRTPNGDVKYVP